MPAPISIIIPTLNSETDLHETLGSLFEGIEKASGIDVAGKIIEYLEDQHSKRDKSKPIDI